VGEIHVSIRSAIHSQDLHDLTYTVPYMWWSVKLEMAEWIRVVLTVFFCKFYSLKIRLRYDVLVDHSLFDANLSL